VSLSSDGTLLATGGRDRTVRLWKYCGDEFELLLAVDHLPGLVRELQFAPTGRLLVLLDHARAVDVWDVNRLNAQLAELKLGW
jgi:WD40 repeat protein